MDDINWGPGEKAKTAKPIIKTKVGDTPVDIVQGEHPHSRNYSDHYARFPDGQIESFHGHRLLWTVHASEYNYLKESELSGSDVREGCNIEIFCNGKKVYEFFHRSIEAGLLEARAKIITLEELPVAVWEDTKKLIDRKIWWRDQPGVITHVLLDQGCVIIAPEPGTKFKPPPYREEDDDDEDDVKVEIDSPHIWWWRK